MILGNWWRKKQALATSRFIPGAKNYPNFHQESFHIHSCSIIEVSLYYNPRCPICIHLLTGQVSEKCQVSGIFLSSSLCFCHWSPQSSPGMQQSFGFALLAETELNSSLHSNSSIHRSGSQHGHFVMCQACLFIGKGECSDLEAPGGGLGMQIGQGPAALKSL